MYAIIRTGGHQEKVTAGERIIIDRIRNSPGESIELSALMVSTDDGAVVSDPVVLKEKAAVVGTVLEHVRGDKVDVFQYRQKTGYRRHIGHRQALTVVEIAEIRFGDVSVKAEEAKESAATKASEDARAAAERWEQIKKEREERKAAKKGPAKKEAAAGARKAPAKKTAAKKTTAKKTTAPKTAPKKKPSKEDLA